MSKLAHLSRHSKQNIPKPTGQEITIFLASSRNSPPKNKQQQRLSAIPKSTAISQDSPKRPKTPKPVGLEMSIFFETVTKKTKENKESELFQRPFLETDPMAWHLWFLVFLDCLEEYAHLMACGFWYFRFFGLSGEIYSFSISARLRNLWFLVFFGLSQVICSSHGLWVLIF